jgi:hypothetical protein
MRYVPFFCLRPFFPLRKVMCGPVASSPRPREFAKPRQDVVIHGVFSPYPSADRITDAASLRAVARIPKQSEWHAGRIAAGCLPPGLETRGGMKWLLLG